MGSATEDREKAAKLPEGDVIRILLEQHAQVRDLFHELESAVGDQKQSVFDDLRALLAVHETAEEMVLRPVSKSVAGEAVADARNEEEREANAVLADLEKIDVNSPDFDRQLVSFKQSVDQHAEKEETEEFPYVLSQCSAEERAKLGHRLQGVEKLAPTHPHPSAAGSPMKQAAAGPFASIVDRVRDALSKD